MLTTGKQGSKDNMSHAAYEVVFDNLPTGTCRRPSRMTWTPLIIKTPELVNQRLNGQTIIHIKNICQKDSGFNAEEREKGCTGKSKAHNQVQ